MTGKLAVETVSEGRLSLVKLAGTIDEDFGGKALASKLDADTLILDLGGIKKISSFGIREWVDFIGSVAARDILLVECAPKVIDQINMVANFTGRGHVVSFFAPFRCDYCDSEHRVLMRVHADADAIRAKKLPERPCPSCKQPMYFDDDGAIFFSYLATQPAFDLDPAAAVFLASKLQYTGDRRLRVDKRVDGKVTFLRLSGDLDRGFPRDKLAEGLEGTVIADVTALGAIDPAGAAEWRAFVREISPAIELLLVAGASPAFVERLCGKDDLGPKTIVLSLALPYRCEPCDATTPQMIEVALHHDVLRFATAPALRCPTCKAAMACVAGEGLMTVLPGLRLPTTNDRAMYLRAKSPPPQLRVVPAKQSSGLLLAFAVLLGIVAVSLGLLWVVVWRHGDAHAPVSTPTPPPAAVVPPTPAWAQKLGCATDGPDLVCVVASYPAAIADDAAADASDAAYDALAAEISAHVPDGPWRDTLGPALAARTAKLAAATTDPAARRDVRDIRRAVAAALRPWIALTAMTYTGRERVVIDRFDEHGDAGVTTYARLVIASEDVSKLRTAARHARDALGATAVRAFPLLAWRSPRLDHGVAIVAVGAGPLHDLGVAPGEVVTAIDGQPMLDANGFATAADDYAALVKTGGTFRVQLLAADGTTRELTKQLPAPRGTPLQPTVPTGGVNIWDRTNGRDDPKN